MLVAMPTAMPAEPLTSRFGVARRQDDRLLRAAVVVGLEVDGVLVDVADHLQASGAIRHSVYRIAAAESLPGEPKLPWPWISGARITHGCASRTRVS